MASIIVKSKNLSTDPPVAFAAYLSRLNSLGERRGKKSAPFCSSFMSGKKPLGEGSSLIPPRHYPLAVSPRGFNSLVFLYVRRPASEASNENGGSLLEQRTPQTKLPLGPRRNQNLTRPLPPPSPKIKTRIRPSSRKICGSLRCVAAPSRSAGSTPFRKRPAPPNHRPAPP